MTQRRAHELGSNENEIDSVYLLNKYLEEQNNNSDILNYSGVMGPAKKILKDIFKSEVSVSNNIGPETSSLRVSINTCNLCNKNKVDKEKPSEALAYAVKCWQQFAEAVSEIGNLGAKVFVQINEDKATVHFLIKTEELLSG